MTWINYAEKLGRPADFEVSYRILTAEEGGRRDFLPRQGYRCDWSYDDTLDEHELYMIFPEFLDAGGVPIEADTPASSSGKALMWVVVPEMRDVHRKRISVGVKGYFREGKKRVGVCVVTRVIALGDKGHE